MKKCPDKETLEKFLNSELSATSSQDILSHLSSCDMCRATIKGLFLEEKKLLSVLLLQPSSDKAKSLAQDNKCLPRAAILAYASECLNEEQTKIVEYHLEKCDHCLSELINIQELLNSSTEVDLDMSALTTEKSNLAETMSGILEIILKAKGDLLEVVKYDGELLSVTPQLSPVRGKEQVGKEAIIVRKDFKDKDFSIEIKITKKLDKSGAKLKISVMKLSTEEFISGIDVSLSSKNIISQKEKTDEDGMVEFHGIRNGKYNIKIQGKDCAFINIE
jgi:hypothetical protein